MWTILDSELLSVMATVAAMGFVSFCAWVVHKCGLVIPAVLGLFVLSSMSVVVLLYSPLDAFAYGVATVEATLLYFLLREGSPERKPHA